MKKYFIGIGIFIVALVVYNVFLKLIYVDSDFSCGRILNQEEIRGRVYYIYKFNVGKEEYSGNAVVSNNLSLSDLKQMNCIKVKYSKWNPSYNKIEDPRIKIRE